ncbi:MAG: matrixin family metalloprotease, partial [Planctomycetota bacterium]
IDTVGAALDSATVVGTIREALEIWQLAGIRFHPAQPGEAPDIMFAWRSTKHPDCPSNLAWDGGVAHSGPVQSGTFVHFNRDLGWSEHGPRGYGLLQSALHEIGHVLGLGHSLDPNAVMHGRYDPSHGALARCDRQGIHSLYGGGEASDGDVSVVSFTSEGKPEILVPLLRGIAPLSRIQLDLLDIDSDGSTELLAWPLERLLEGGLTIYYFGAKGRLRRTVGPIPGMSDPTLTTHCARTTGGRALLVHRLPEQRYMARVFSDRGLPITPWPTGKPLLLQNGQQDIDGDGVFDVSEVKTPLLTKAPGSFVERHPDWVQLCATDLNRDGRDDLLFASPVKNGRQTYRWLLARESGWHPGASFSAEDGRIGDLDGDGEVEGVFRELATER